MNTHKAMKLPFGFLAVARISMSSPAVLTAARPLQIIWEQTAQEGGTFSVDFSPDGQKLASGGAYIVQSGAQLYYAENKVWRAHDGTLLAATPRDQRNHLLTHRPNCRDCERRSLLLSQRRLRRGRAWCGGLLDPAAKPFGYYRDIPD